jgi:hypothetical protein
MERPGTITTEVTKGPTSTNPTDGRHFGWSYAFQSNSHLCAGPSPLFPPTAEPQIQVQEKCGSESDATIGTDIGE